jgi:hypothetical protein
MNSKAKTIGSVILAAAGVAVSLVIAVFAFKVLGLFCFFAALFDNGSDRAVAGGVANGLEAERRAASDGNGRVALAALKVIAPPRPGAADKEPGKSDERPFEKVAPRQDVKQSDGERPVVATGKASTPPPPDASADEAGRKQVYAEAAAARRNAERLGGLLGGLLGTAEEKKRRREVAVRTALAAVAVKHGLIPATLSAIEAEGDAKGWAK